MYDCAKQGLRLFTSYVVAPLFVFSELRWDWEVIGRFVDIGGIVDHHC